MDTPFREQRRVGRSVPRRNELLECCRGAACEARGLYRPEADCIMFTRNPVGFCSVRRRAMDRIVGLYRR